MLLCWPDRLTSEVLTPLESVSFRYSHTATKAMPTDASARTKYSIIIHLLTLIPAQGIVVHE
jgi:hypothetical protein